jgi:hypothetical protein
MDDVKRELLDARERLDGVGMRRSLIHHLVLSRIDRV